MEYVLVMVKNGPAGCRPLGTPSVCSPASPPRLEKQGCTPTLVSLNSFKTVLSTAI